MTTTIRTICASGLLLGACVFASPATASAQGKSHKEQKVERQIDRKVDKQVDKQVDGQVAKIEQRRVNRVVNRTTRTRVLCDDGTWAYASTGCGGHGGLASRQYKSVPRASAQGIAHANANSAVARAAYANGISAGAIARCNDGTYWHGANRTNACYRHGGVARWL